MVIIDQIFKLKKLEGGSERYGVCEHCNKAVDVTYLLAVKNIVNHKGSELIPEGPMHFGHKRCMEKITHNRGEFSC